VGSLGGLLSMGTNTPLRFVAYLYTQVYIVVHLLGFHLHIECMEYHLENNYSGECWPGTILFPNHYNVLSPKYI
jgi:hypothetical protein